MRRKYPRSVRGAGRRGWSVVTLPVSALEKHNTSWQELNIWASKQTKNHFVNNYQTRQFAFESEADASWFSLKWAL